MQRIDAGIATDALSVSVLVTTVSGWTYWNAVWGRFL